MLNCIVAVDQNQGIGFQNTMPWPFLKEDLKFFKNITTNNVVVMGSNTYKSIGKALPNRINIVITKNIYSDADHLIHDPNLVLNFCNTNYPDKEIFIIGGSAVYETFKFLIDRFYITEIGNTFTCDRFFDLDYVRNNFPKIKTHFEYHQPIPFTIKEYNL
jgi:dihydrofolate reductase